MKAVPIIKKIVVALLTALFVSFITFGLLYLSPGDPVELMMNDKMGDAVLNEAVMERYAELLGTNKGFFGMYRAWLYATLHGDLGRSYNTGLPVIQEFGLRIGCSAKLAVFSTLISSVLGIGLGILSARKKNGFADRLTRIFSSISISVPAFWLAILFLWVFAVKLDLFPIASYDGFRSLILPAFVMGISGCASLIRITRISILDNLSEGYVLTARARGLSERRVFLGHILKNVMLPIVTMLTASLIAHVGGSVIIENIFSLPGTGNYLLRAIKIKDYPVVLGFILLKGLIVIVLTTLADFLYYAIDPRIRQGLYEKK